MTSLAARSRAGQPVAVLAVMIAAGCGGPQTPSSATAVERRQCTAALRLEEADAGELDTAPARATDTPEPAPRTTVRLVLICEQEPTRSVRVSVEVGACFRTDPQGGALLSAHCWWAGTGSDLEVRRSGALLIVRRATAESPTMERAAQLELPEDADVQPL